MRTILDSAKITAKFLFATRLARNLPPKAGELDSLIVLVMHIKPFFPLYDKDDFSCASFHQKFSKIHEGR